MTSEESQGRTLTELQPPRRNRYYYGKLLDVLQMSTEQQYGLAASQQLNRLSLGAGVLCGLEVTGTAAASGVQVSAGLAIDGWGRRIIVPYDYTLEPLQLADGCGSPLPAGVPLPASVALALCYRQNQSDFAPTLVSDPGCGGCESCQAGTWVETFAVTVTDRSAPPANLTCAPAVLAQLRAGDVHAALTALSRTVVPTPPDPCVPLANITVDQASGSLTVDPITPRPVAPTNQDLLALIVCLAQQILPASGSDFAIGGVTLGLHPPGSLPQARPVPLPAPDARVTVPLTANDHWWIHFELVNGVPTQASVLSDPVAVTTNAEPAVSVPGSLGLNGTTLVWTSAEALGVGSYRVTLSASLISTSGAAIDGDATAHWPTGDGQPGGDFIFTFDVAEVPQ